MNLEFVNTVLQVIGQHGIKVLADASKCGALLLENAKGKHEPEINLFIKVLVNDPSVDPQAAEEMTCFLRELITGEVEILDSTGKVLIKNGLHFLITDGQSLSLAEGSMDSSIVIPENVLGIPVTSIWKMAFRGCVNLTEIVIPPSVTDIGFLAFATCNNLTKITVSRHTNFGENVFSENTKIVYY